MNATAIFFAVVLFLAVIIHYRVLESYVVFSNQSMLFKDHFPLGKYNFFLNYLHVTFKKNPDSQRIQFIHKKK